MVQAKISLTRDQILFHAHSRTLSGIKDALIEGENGITSSIIMRSYQPRAKVERDVSPDNNTHEFYEIHRCNINNRNVAVVPHRIKSFSDFICVFN